MVTESGNTVLEFKNNIEFALITVTVNFYNVEIVDYH